LPALDWRLVLLLCLWGYFLFTTYHAIAAWAAWPRFFEVSKTFVPLLLTLVLINTREKLFYLIITIATCFALLVLKGGYWAFMTGFSDRVYGPPGSHFYDNNHFAIAVIMTIPLLVLWLRETTDNRLRYILMGMIFLSAASALSSWSRGALLSLGVTTLFLVWHSRRKYLAIPLVLVGIFLTFQFLPQTWFERMQTLQEYETEGSASSRLETWKVGLDYAVQHPFTGAGFEGWRYVTFGSTGIDWHNAYIEVMAEHGFIAFAIWLSLLIGSIISLSRLARLAKQSPELTWIRNCGLMLQGALIAYAAGAMFLGLSYWDILYHLIIITVVLKQLARRQVCLAE
jgi:probable O-glycosylation ligase (exosortase A-associated)